MASTARTTAAGEEDIANQEKNAGTLSAIGDVAGSLLKGAAAVAGFAVPGPVGSAAASVIGPALAVRTKQKRPASFWGRWKRDGARWAIGGPAIVRTLSIRGGF